MGTTVELVLDARRRASALSTPRSRSSSVSSRSCRASGPTSELSWLNRDRLDRRVPELADVVELASTRASGPAVASIRRCTTHSSQPATTERSRSCRPTARRDPPQRAAATSSSSAVASRSPTAFASTSAASARATRPSASLSCSRSPARASSAPAATSPCAACRRQGRGPSRSTSASPSGSSAADWRRPGIDRRRWRRGGVEQHHLIDPRTARPAVGDLIRVTAIGSDAVDAEVLAKTLLLSQERPRQSEAGVPAVLADERRPDRHHRRPLMHHDPTFWLLARAAGSPPTHC